MVDALPILPLIASIASLGSWLFSQWLSEQRRAFALALGLACYLAYPAVAALAHESMSSEELQRRLRADECYSRVTAPSKAAARSGQPPVVSFH